MLSGSEDKTVKLWDAATGALLRTFEGHSDWVISVAFSPDGTRVLSGSVDDTLKLWDAATGELLRTFEGHARRGQLGRVLARWGPRAVGQRGQHAEAVGRGHGRAAAHLRGALERGQLGRVLARRGPRAVGELDKTVKLWDAATGQLLRTFEGHADVVNSVAFSPDGTRVLSGSDDKTLKLWDAATGQLLRTFEGHTDEVTSVAFSPDGTRCCRAAWTRR